MKKNDIVELEILDNGMNFEGIARVDNKVVFVPEAIKGEKILAKIIKVNNSFCIGKIQEIKEKSKKRSEPFCSVYKRCGGCSGQHISYEKQLDIKYDLVKATLAKQKVEYKELTKVVGMGIPFNYRNKAQYPVRKNMDGENKIGFYAKRSHEIIENEECLIQNEDIDRLSKEVFKLLLLKGFSGYNEQDNSGDIRHILIRRGYHTSETMIVIIVNKKEVFDDVRMEEVVEILKNNNEDIKSIVLNLNTSKTNEILGKEEKIVYGSGYITDYIGKYKYYISSKSFFQVNTVQAEVLYNTLKELLELKGNEILFDLYSGVGSIGIFLSDCVKQVYGIEIEEQAVKMANMNMKENCVQNAEYIAGSVESKIVEYEKREIKPDVIVVDPPRKGLDLDSIEYILKFRPEKIGYVSCSPATFARDLKLLSQYYEIGTVIPVDMFPNSEHIENVTVLTLKK
ncbi:MAG: 23S rRNA (uracil(1939)-C(5))-methyltransferase RlmD [Clostridia bacterium]|nr:23S rRNA (uracil(1939)-C(5))-methyltransferase RlmD [Clostridia bacterium]